MKGKQKRGVQRRNNLLDHPQGLAPFKLQKPRLQCQLAKKSAIGTRKATHRSSILFPSSIPNSSAYIQPMDHTSIAWSHGLEPAPTPGGAKTPLRQNPTFDDQLMTSAQLLVDSHGKCMEKLPFSEHAMVYPNSSETVVVPRVAVQNIQTCLLCRVSGGFGIRKYVPFKTGRLAASQAQTLVVQSWDSS